MKLYIKQKVFSWKDQFYVKDKDGKNVYKVEGEIFTWGKKLHIYDTEGKEIAFLKQKLWTFLPRFEVIIDDEKRAEVIKEFSFFQPKYSVQGPNWEIIGDFWAHNYEIIENDKTIVNITKEWLTWGDSYELDIKDSENEILALAIVIAIDVILEAQSDSNN